MIDLNFSPDDERFCEEVRQFVPEKLPDSIRRKVLAGATHVRRQLQGVPRAFLNLDVPVVAAINGPAVGAGLDFALMCDMRIASTVASFAESFIRVGLIPGDGGAWFLPRVVRMAAAMEMALTAEAIDPARP